MDLWEVMIILEEWAPDDDEKVAPPTSEEHRRAIERFG